MESEGKIILTFLFKRSGKEKLTFSELYLGLSINLNWFTPEDAKKFIISAIEKKYLKKENDLIKPCFNIEKVSVPIGFSPTKQIFFQEEIKKTENKEKDLFSQMMLKIENISKLNKQKILDNIKKIEQEKKVIPEVALILLAKQKNIDLSEFFEKTEKKIFLT